MPKRQGRKSKAQTPAPAKDRIYGSKKNPKGSAASEKSASKIKLDEKTLTALQNKLKDFKEKHPKKKNITLADLKAVFRRGAGAYSKSHRPFITGGVPNSRNAWAFARVNKFLKKAAGQKVKAAYVQDDDLLKREDGGTIDSMITCMNCGWHWKESETYPEDKYICHNCGFDNEPYYLKKKGGLIAPNGKPSNLTPEQYKIVRTPQFKAWFGDWENDPENASKVVDENGEPLVVYHGSDYEFTVFKNDRQIYFATNKEYASEISESGRVKSFFLNIRNLLDATKFYIDDYSFLEYKTFLRKNGIDVDIAIIQDSNIVSKFWYLMSNSFVWKSIKEKYDGYSMYENMFATRGKIEEDDFDDPFTKVYVCFEPNQIKLADGSNKTFDPNNPDIRYKDGGMTNESKVYRDSGNNQLNVGDDVVYEKWFYDFKYRLKGKILEFIHESFRQSKASSFGKPNQGVRAKIEVYEKFDAERGLQKKFPKISIIRISNLRKLGEDGKPLNYNVLKDGGELYHLGGDMSKHLAPNGKPSNLTPEQYKLVRTPQFKAWFGDWENDPNNASKVVDENGEPLVLYRGNLVSQEELGYTFNLGHNFLKKKSGNEFGFFFTNEIDTAKKYMLVDHFDEIRGGSITSVFIQSNKILDLLDFGLKIGEDNFVKGLIEKGVIFTNEYSYLKKEILDFNPDNDKYWGYNVFDYFDVFPELRNLFIKNGFNSVIFYEMSRRYRKYKVYVAFSPNQIKLADGSNTTFDASNPDIRYSRGGKINHYYRAETSNDFKKEKIFEPNGYYERVGKDGNPVIKYDEYVISDTPEIAASKTIYGAILGAASMMKFSQGIKKNNKIQIYLIDEKPDVDISHWQGADFEYLDEVRYRNSIVGKHLLTYELTDDVYRLVKDFYEYKEWENNLKYDDQLELDNRLEYIYQMIEDEKFYSTLKKLIDKSQSGDIRYAKGGKTFNDKELLAKWKRGESIGFTATAHLKAKGLIPRSDGEKRKSPQYKRKGGLIGGFEDLEDEWLSKKIEIFLDKVKPIKYYFVDPNTNTLTVGFDKYYSQDAAQKVYEEATSSKEFFHAPSVESTYDSKSGDLIFKIKLKKEVKYNDGGEVDEDDEDYQKTDWQIEQEIRDDSLVDLILHTEEYALNLSDRYILSHEKNIEFRNKEQDNEIHYKPKGLWYAFNYEWADWVYHEMPRYARDYDFVHKIEVTDKVLRLDTIDKCLEFTKKYGIYDRGSFSPTYQIDWIQVAKDYSGIEVTQPYKWSRIHEHEYTLWWLYGWDVGSGCVWNEDGVKSIELVHSYYAKGGEIDPKVLRKRWEKKKDALENLANNIQRLRTNLYKDLKGSDNKEKLTALVIITMNETGERVGNDESADNGHLGITGLKKKNVSVKGSKIKFKYTGKSAVEHEKEINNHALASAFKEAIKNSPSEYVFETSDGFRIKNDRVNRYLNEFDVSAKDLRGYSANQWIVSKLREVKDKEILGDEAKRKKKFNEIVKSVAERVGHGAPTLKKHYMLPALEREWVNNGKIVDLSNIKRTYEDGGVINYASGGSPRIRMSEANEIKDYIKKQHEQGKSASWGGGNRGYEYVARPDGVFLSYDIVRNKYKFFSDVDSFVRALYRLQVRGYKKGGDVGVGDINQGANVVNNIDYDPLDETQDIPNDGEGVFDRGGDISKYKDAKNQFAKDLQEDKDYIEVKRRSMYDERGRIPPIYQFGVPNVITNDPYVKKEKYKHIKLDDSDINDDDDEYAKGGNIDSNDVIIYHEEKGNWLVPKNLVYGWVYDDPKAAEKLESGEYDYILFPPRGGIGLFSQKGYVPPLLKVWTKKYQDKTKGANKLIGIVQGWYDEENKKLYIEMMTTKKSMRRKGVNSIIVKELRDYFNLDREDVIFDKPTKEGKMFAKSEKFEDGGDVYVLDVDENIEYAKGGDVTTIEVTQLSKNNVNFDYENKGYLNLEKIPYSSFHVDYYADKEGLIKELNKYGVNKGEKVWTIQGVVVKPKYRGQGIASILMAAAIQWAKQNDYKKLFLLVDAQGKKGLNNEQLTDFYSRYKFKSLKKTYGMNWMARKLNNGGEVDLFEHYDELPPKVQAILEKYENEENDYATLESLQGELEEQGYTFEYGLDYEPYGLRKMDRGGEVAIYPKRKTEYFDRDNKKWVIEPFTLKKGQLIIYNHSDGGNVEARFLAKAGDKAKIEILHPYSPWTKRVEIRGYVNPAGRTEPDYYLNEVPRGTIKTVSVNLIEIANDKYYSYWQKPISRWLKSPEFKEAFSHLDNPNSMAKGGEISDEEKKETYKKWKSLVNMSKSELEKFYNSEEGKVAGLSASQAKSLGISSGRESARWIMKMKDTSIKNWTPTMWKWAKKQINFISRMSGNKGKLVDDKGVKTRKHTSLLIWGHNPIKKAGGGEINIPIKENAMNEVTYNQLPAINEMGVGKKFVLKEHYYNNENGKPTHRGCRYLIVENLGEAQMDDCLKLKVHHCYGGGGATTRGIITRPLKNIMNKGREMGEIVSSSVEKAFKRGGELDPDKKEVKQYFEHKSGSAGGLLVGKRHSEGGIQAINKSTGQPLEMEGGEVVITRDAVSDSTLHDFNGKQMTNREILSAINESGGGVKFADGGDVSCKCSGKEYKFGGKTYTDRELFNKINNSYGSKSAIEKGMKVEDEEHRDTFTMLKNGEITYEAFLKRLVADKLSNNPKYYDN